MGAKAVSYSQGDLVVLWPEGKAPKVENTTLRRIYAQVFLPALRADVMRLHDVMVASLQTLDRPDMEGYVAGLGSLKAVIGRSAIPDIAKMEKEIGACHKKFMARRMPDFEWDILDIAESRRTSEIAPGEDAFLETRYRCIGFDTSDAIREIAALMRSDKGRAALYVATIQGGDALDDLLKVEWMNDRRKNDINRLRDRMHECTLRVRMAESIAYARQHDTSKPKASDLDEAMRVNNLRVIAGTACKNV